MGSKMMSNFRTRYKVECKIGEGSFSDVLKCRDKETGKLVAAKQLKKTFKNALDVSEVPELIAMRKLTAHANILHLLESHFDRLTGKVVLLFDLMDSSLYDMIKNRKTPFPEARSKNYLYQMIKGVEHIHSHGIFHRDIKPENILVKGNLLKISDLGSIKGIYNHHPYTEYIGTRWYRSPECLLTTGFYGPKVDVWAIGCVFYELLTLKPLFPGSSEIDQIVKINNILGTPSYRLMAKIQKHKSRNISNFASKQGTGLNALIPFMSEVGRDVLKQMLVYDPDLRINIRRLRDHKYFEDYKDLEVFQRGMAMTSLSASCVPTVSRINNTWKNPALLSYLTNDRRRKKVTLKLKKTKTTVKKDSESGMGAKVAVSGLTQRMPSSIQQSSVLRGTKRIGDAQSVSSVAAGDLAVKTTSNPVIARRMRKQENQLIPSKSLRVGIGYVNRGRLEPSQR